MTQPTPGRVPAGRDRELDAKLDVVLFGHGLLGKDTMRHDRLEYPHYSTTGDGMLLVLEKMRERGFRFTLETRNPVRSDLAWKPWAQFHRYKDGVPMVIQSAEADTLPRAVALAALAALEVSA